MSDETCGIFIDQPSRCRGYRLAHPGTRYSLTKYGFEPVAVEETGHFRRMLEFCGDPAALVEAMMED